MTVPTARRLQMAIAEMANKVETFRAAAADFAAKRDATIEAGNRMRLAAQEAAEAQTAYAALVSNWFPDLTTEAPLAPAVEASSPQLPVLPDHLRGITFAEERAE